MIVVTGAAGFIGSCIVARLNAQGHEDLILVDHIEPGETLKEANLKGKKYREYVDKDEFLKKVLTGELDPKVDVIIHMGACSSTTLQDAQHFEKNNFQYTRHLAQWCLDQGTHFIYASSAATYGDGEQGYSDDHSVIPELRPLNLYGKSKQKFDWWALSEGVLDQMVGLKFFNVFGPNEYHKGDMRSVVNKAYPQVVAQGMMRLFKSYKPEYRDGEQQRDFIYVKDAVDVVMHFFHHRDLRGIYNVGTGKARSWNDLALALFSAVGKTPQIEYVEMPEILRPRYQYFTQADMRKLKASGYKKPFTFLEEAVKDYVSYLKDNRHW